jgi:hypothetical protein
MTGATGNARSPLALGARIRVKEGVLVQQLQGEAVLLNLDSGMYFGLDPVGTRMWELMTEHERLSDVVLAMLAEYDVSAEECGADLLALVARLEAEGLVSVA